MWRHFLISATFIKIRTSCALIRWLSQPNQMKLINFILTFPCAYHRDAPNADFICKTRETHNICVSLTKNNNFRDKIPPEAAGQRKGQVFHDGFPPEGAGRLKANICRDDFVPEGARQSKGSTFRYVRTYVRICPALIWALIQVDLVRMTWISRSTGAAPLI